MRLFFSDTDIVPSDSAIGINDMGFGPDDHDGEAVDWAAGADGAAAIEDEEEAGIIDSFIGFISGLLESGGVTGEVVVDTPALEAGEGEFANLMAEEPQEQPGAADPAPIVTPR
jgi:hypothetical protein